MALVSLLATIACLASPVHTTATGTTVVQAGPFVGYAASGYDVVRGRFSLHVGPYRTQNRGLSQKIPWFVAPKHPVGESLVISGRRLTPPVRRFSQEFARAQGPESDPRSVFPTIISPPSAGCWRLTFRSQDATGTLTALVRRF